LTRDVVVCYGNLAVATSMALKRSSVRFRLAPPKISMI
jgi:hypothetical protein